MYQPPTSCVVERGAKIQNLVDPTHIPAKYIINRQQTSSSNFQQEYKTRIKKSSNCRRTLLVCFHSTQQISISYQTSQANLVNYLLEGKLARRHRHSQRPPSLNHHMCFTWPPSETIYRIVVNALSLSAIVIDENLPNVNKTKHPKRGRERHKMEGTTLYLLWWDCSVYPFIQQTRILNVTGRQTDIYTSSSRAEEDLELNLQNWLPSEHSSKEEHMATDRHSSDHNCSRYLWIYLQRNLHNDNLKVKWQ